MGVEDIKLCMMEIREGTKAYKDHVNECQARSVDMRKYMFRKQTQTFQCHACGKHM